MRSNRGELFNFIGFLSTRGTCIGKRITFEKTRKLIESYELSQWSPLDDREKESLRRHIAQRESQADK